MCTLLDQELCIDVGYLIGPSSKLWALYGPWFRKILDPPLNNDNRLNQQKLQHIH